MCLAIPMRIAEIDGAMALTELQGVTRRASIMLVPEARVGDYILVHAGCAITVLDEADAQETLRLIEEIAAFDDEMGEAETGAGKTDEGTTGPADRPDPTGPPGPGIA